MNPTTPREYPNESILTHRPGVSNNAAIHLDDDASFDACVRRDDGLFPIRAVAHITDINPITLRAWERRYGLICPLRTDTGHRLYSADDIEKIQRVKTMSAQGMGFAQIAALLDREAQQTTREIQPESPPPSQTRTARDINPAQTHAPTHSANHSTSVDNLIERTKAAVMHLDSFALRAIEHQALLWLPPDVLLRAVLIETLHQLEQRDAWPDRDLGLHWFSHYIRARLDWWLFQNTSSPANTSPLVLIDIWEMDRPIMAKEFGLIMRVAELCTVKILPDTLSQAQRIRLCHRWQARHWIRLINPAHTATALTREQTSGTTQLHWFQLLADDHPLNRTESGICQGGLSHCQRYLIEKMAADAAATTTT